MILLEIEEKLKKTMTREISLFSLYKEEFGKMKDMVIRKEWVNLQRSFDAVQNISNKIACADSERDDLYGELCRQTGSSKGDSFYSVIARIHENDNGEINDIYRIVKHEANSVKVLTDGFSRFVQTRKNLINEIMEELVPDRKGTIYNRKGFSSQNGSSSSLILNKHL